MSVADDDVFYRRVRWAKRITDQRSGEVRPSSDSFRDSTDPPSPMSGLLRSVVLATGRSVDSLFPGDGSTPSSGFRSGIYAVTASKSLPRP